MIYKKKILIKHGYFFYFIILIFSVYNIFFWQTSIDGLVSILKVTSWPWQMSSYFVIYASLKLTNDYRILSPLLTKL